MCSRINIQYTLLFFCTFSVKPMLCVCYMHVYMFLCCVPFFLDTSILFLCAHSLFYTPCIFVQCAFCQCVHSPAAVCLHRSVCSQVLIKCGFLYTWLIWNIGILRPPACLCNELEDGKQEINLEWPNCAIARVANY